MQTKILLPQKTNKCANFHKNTFDRVIGKGFVLKHKDVTSSKKKTNPGILVKWTHGKNLGAVELND